MRKFIFTIVILSTPFAEKVFSQNVGINLSGASPDASAGLDVDFTSKGVLIPRLTLTQTSSASPVTSPATSLLVYNTASVNDVTPGYYYWDGTQWVRLLNGTGAGAAWMTNGNAASGSDFLGTTSNFPLVIKTNNLEQMRVQANGTLKITGTAITSPGIWMDGTVSAAASTAYGILSRGTLTAAANGDGFFPFSTNLGTVNTGTFTGLSYYAGHFDAASSIKTGTGTIDNAYGIYATAPSIGTNNYGGAFMGNGNQLKLLLSSGSSTALTTIDFGLATPTDPEGSLSIAASAGQFSEFAVAQDVILRARKNNLILCTRNVSSPTTGDIIFGTGMPNTEKMRIANNGNVGIANGSPSYKMDIGLNDGDGIRMSSTIHATFDANAYENVIRPLSTNNTNGVNKPNNSIFLQGLSMGTTYGSFQMLANATNSEPLIYWRTEINNTGVWNPWLQMAAYNSSGNLGVNTTSPTAQLDVNGSTGYNQLRMRTSYTPANTADANGNTGDIAWDANYIYVKTPGGWMRSALSAF